MCGIAGVIDHQLGREELDQILDRMQGNLRHRGPDDQGSFVSRDTIAGLVNTRLAILDLSPAGHQPMRSLDRRYAIVFNGEIYNFRELRRKLEMAGETFVSDSDTEVVLRMFAISGVACLRQLEGMFAFAVWDEQEKVLFVGRDPLGIKPLYYYASGARFCFASEIRPLLKSGLVPRRMSAAGAQGYFLYGSVPEPTTLIENVWMLPAGQYLTWRNGETRLTKFWDLHFADERCAKAEVVPQVRNALFESVQRHLVSDVPVGVFLSGGIDSTAIVALAAREPNSDLRTFCISFDDPKFNEGEVAARTAKHFGASHTDWRLDPVTARSLLEQFIASSDQPSIDGLNTFCVSKLAHDQGLKVVLSGLGGDELFGGYKSFEMVPKMVRASRLATPVSALRWAAGKALQVRYASPRTNRLGRFLTDVPITSVAYWAMRGIFTPQEVGRLLPRYGCKADAVSSAIALHVPPQPTVEDEVSYLEVTRYMRNQLLRDSDVMSMAWGLELRVPFVDRRLIESIQRIPAAFRLAKGKQILIDAVPEIPQWVTERPKQGFTFPFKDWISNEWQDVFRQIEASSPVRLKSWYRTWCLFALESFLDRNGIEMPDRS